MVNGGLSLFVEGVYSLEDVVVVVCVSFEVGCSGKVLLWF